MAIFRDDIRKKLKVAIIKKLEELGIEVEKELPDYILSIITNRKDKDYMTKSLSVFLGNKTKIFTEWVYTISTRIADSQKLNADRLVNVYAEHNENTEDIMKSRKRRSEAGDIDCGIHIKRGEAFAQKEKDHDNHKRSTHKKTSTSDQKHHHRDHKDREERRHKDRENHSRPTDMETDEVIPVPKVPSSVILVNPFDEVPRIASKVVVKRRVPDVSKAEARSHRSIFQKAIEAVKNPPTERKPKNSVFVELEERSPSPERYVTVRIELEPSRQRHDSHKKTVDADSENSMKNEKENSIHKEPERVDTIHSVPESPKLERFRKPPPRSSSEETNIFEGRPIPNLNFSFAANKFEKGNAYKVKCKYWPECTSSNCGYVHPNKPCQSFPKCIFGKDCIFIHPPCRYAKECKNEYCTYTHGSSIALRKLAEMLELSSELQRVDSKSATPTNTLCYFAGHCTDKACKYKHPPRCTFGERCTKGKSCIFYHGPIGKPETPSKSLYYWQAST